MVLDFEVKFYAEDTIPIAKDSVIVTWRPFPAHGPDGGMG